MPKETVIVRYNGHVAITGNCQNWPKRDSDQKDVRRIVRALEPNFKIVAFDYAGIQARNVAMESNDKTLVDAFWHRYDIHGDWMERIIRTYPQWADGKKLASDKVLRKEFRNRAKNELVFPSFFGAQARSVAGYLGVPEHVGEALHDEFWDMFPNIKDWHEALQEHYREKGYVTGLSGYRRRVPISPNELINAPIQADEALIVCDAWYRLAMMGDNLTPILMVHDDLTFCWHKNEIDRNVEIVVKEMLRINYNWINVPLGVEVSIGDDWGSLETVGEYFSDQIAGHKRAA